MYLHVLVVHHWVIEIIVDNVRRQIAGPFLGIGDDEVEVDLEVKKADFWGAGVAVVGELVATDCQANAMRFSLGDFDVAEKFGIGYLFVFGDGVFGDKKGGIGPVNVFGGQPVFTPTLC